MDESKFWACIELIYSIPEKLREQYDFEELQNHLIKKYLKQHDLKDLLGFQKILAEKVLHLFQPKIADIFNLTAYPFKKNKVPFKYFSEDGFLDFRLWIICLGQEHYNTFLYFKQEEELLDYNLDPNYAYVSGLDFFVNEIYKEMNPEDKMEALDYCEQYGVDFYFDGDYHELTKEMHWNNLNEVYPQLFKKYQAS